MPMQTSQKIMLLVVALLVGVATIFLSRGMMSQPESTPMIQAQSQQETQEVLVAAQDLPSGSLIKANDLKWQVWPKDDNAASYAVKGQQDIQNYVGNVVRYGMRTGEPLTQGRTVKPGEQGFMAAALEAGKRAVSIAVTPVAGVAGFVFPGDRVDVIVTHSVLPSGTERSQVERHVSETMLKNIRVLALDQKMGDQITEPKLAQVATLEVSPKQAETVALMAQMGTISLSLCSVTTEATAEGETTQTVEGGKVPDVILDAAALATQDAKNPPALGAYTWDSDVSKVMPSPAQRSAGTTQKVTVIRGQMATDTVFDLYQP